MHHAGQHGGKRRAGFDQMPVIIAPLQLHAGQFGARHANALGRRDHLRLAGNHRLALLVHAHAIEQDFAFPGPFLPRRHGGGDRIAHAHRPAELQRLRQVDRARPRQHGAQHRRYQRPAPHAVRDHMVKQVAGGERLVNMRRVHIARHHGEQFDIRLGQRTRNGGAVANGDIVEGAVFNKFRRRGGCGRIWHAVELSERLWQSPPGRYGEIWR